MTTTIDHPVDEERKTRGTKLRQIRRSRGLGLSALAERAGCSNKHLDNLEAGRKRPSIELLYRICRELAVPFDDLAITEDHERVNA